MTGASRGIGRAIAERLAAGGATVVCVARGTNADATAQAITQAGGTAIAHSADVTDTAAVEALLKQTVERYGKLDILVSNAGITRDQLMLRMKRDDWDQVIATNLTATFTLCQAALKPMIKQRAGRIIAIGSVVGQMGNAGQANYAASKAGARSGVAAGDRKCRRAWFCRDRHDQGDCRECEDGLVRDDSARADWQARGDRRGCRLSGV